MFSSPVSFIHCVKNVGIQSYSGTYFPALGLNTNLNAGYDLLSEAISSWWRHTKKVMYNPNDMDSASILKCLCQFTVGFLQHTVTILYNYESSQ